MRWLVRRCPDGLRCVPPHTGAFNPPTKTNRGLLRLWRSEGGREPEEADVKTDETSWERAGGQWSAPAVAPQLRRRPPGSLLSEAWWRCASQTPSARIPQRPRHIPVCFMWNFWPRTLLTSSSWRPKDFVFPHVTVGSTNYGDLRTLFICIIIKGRGKTVQATT